MNSASDTEWLRSDEADLSVGAGPVFDVDDEIWRASIERVTLAPSLQVYLNDIRIHRDITAEPMDEQPAGCIGSQVTIAGGAELEFRDGMRARTTPQRSLLLRVAGPLPNFAFTAGSRYHSVGYLLDAARIERLLGGEVPDALRPMLEPDLQRDRVVATRSGGEERRVATTLFASGLHGPLRRMMMEGVVLQLLALQAAAAGGPLAAPGDGLSARERAAVHEARERLVADMRRPPSLGDLAEAVGLGEKRLNAGFRLLFGETVFETLRNHRLEHARQVLEEGGVALKEIAFRVGYDHVSNFIHAFRARYGATPHQYLRRPPTRR